MGVNELTTIVNKFTSNFMCDRDFMWCLNCPCQCHFLYQITKIDIIEKSFVVMLLTDLKKLSYFVVFLCHREERFMC